MFNKTLLNIFHNFIPNKILLCDNREPAWMNGKIKTVIKRKNELFQNQIKSGNFGFAETSKISRANKLDDPKTARKTY